MVMKELIRCDEETQKTFLQEVSNLQIKQSILAPHQPVVYYSQRWKQLTVQLLLPTFLFFLVPVGENANVAAVHSHTCSLVEFHF